MQFRQLGTYSFGESTLSGCEYICLVHHLLKDLLSIVYDCSLHLVTLVG